jgi:hypothetical protein
VFFVSKDSSLNKAHVQHLEARLLSLAKSAKQCKIDNSQEPLPPTLSEAETADVESFLLDILGIFPLLGLGIFEKTETKKKPTQLLIIESKGIKASGYEDAKGFVVCQGSKGAGEATSSARQNTIQMRKDLLEQGVLVESGTQLVFTQDHVFTSPSLAACVVLGSSVNGRIEWRTPAGLTLKELQAQSTENGEATDV